MQIYITSAKNEFSNGISTLLACTNGIYAWLTNNGLALNPSKSEAIVFQGPRCTENIIKDVIVAGSNIANSSEVKSLGRRRRPGQKAIVRQTRCRGLPCVLFPHPCTMSHVIFTNRRLGEYRRPVHCRVTLQLLQLSMARHSRIKLRPVTESSEHTCRRHHRLHKIRPHYSCAG